MSNQYYSSLWVGEPEYYAIMEYYHRVKKIVDPAIVNPAYQNNPKLDFYLEVHGINKTVVRIHGYYKNNGERKFLFQGSDRRDIEHEISLWSRFGRVSNGSSSHTLTEKIDNALFSNEENKRNLWKYINLWLVLSFVAVFIYILLKIIFKIEISSIDIGAIVVFILSIIYEWVVSKNLWERVEYEVRMNNRTIKKYMNSKDFSLLNSFRFEDWKIARANNRIISVKKYVMLVRAYDALMVLSEFNFQDIEELNTNVKKVSDYLDELEKKMQK